MIQLNPTRIANRIGRIALAIILAGAFVMLVRVPGQVRSESFASLTDPIDLYTTVLISFVTYTVVASLIVPVVICTLWGLSRRFSRVRIWQGILGLTVILTLGLAAEDWGNHFEFMMGTVGLLASAGAILAAIVVVELLFEWEIASETSFEGFVTASGGTIAVVLALVLVVATVSTGALAVADTAGVSLSEEEDEFSVKSLSADELESEYGHYLDAESGDELTCEPATVERENVPAAAETHENDLSDFEINATVYEWATTSSIVYEWNYTGEGTLETQRDGTVENGEVTLDGYWDSQVDEGSYEMVAIDGTTAYNGEDSINGTYVEFDVVNDDGDVIRYTGMLCDANLQSS